MGTISEQPHLEKILVGLEDEHKSLQLSISQLEIEIEKREIEIRKLLTDRESKLVEENSNYAKCSQTHLVDQQEDKTATVATYSSEFAKQVARLLDEITRTAEEVSSLIKL